jgi:CxxC-x17-CxxC domain-containing protein
LKNNKKRGIVTIMKNFQPGGLRNRREDIGGRPRGDINNYAPKERREGGKPAFGKSFGDKRSGGFNPKDRAPRENKSYPAVCSDCGKACDVPFRPDGVKPVLCRECYSKKAPATNMAGSRDRFTPNEQRGHTPAPAVALAEINLITKQLSALEEKVNQILELIKVSEKLVDTIPELVAAEKPKKVAIKKVAKVVEKKVTPKKAPAKKVAVKKVAKKK